MILTAAAVLGGAWVLGPRVREALRPPFAFEPMEDVPGFQLLVTDNVTPAASPFAGLESEESAGRDAGDIGDLCAALHVSPASHAIPVAIFTDYNCPFCRTLNEDVARQARRAAALSLTWHEWPRIAPSSEPAARAALAAERQGAYLAFHRRLMRTQFQPNDAYLRSLAESLSLDADRLIGDMHHPDIDAALSISAALAQRLSLPGTPAMVIGRRVIVGRVSEEELRALIALENDAPSGCRVPDD